MSINCTSVHGVILKNYEYDDPGIIVLLVIHYQNSLIERKSFYARIIQNFRSERNFNSFLVFLKSIKTF
jgi:hypothetical protein